ncbi:MAG TPA: hypothetical protein VFZ59_11395 [Verrucomicrobiae bacterium]|nr:hypothetical protein [Verrucomicrobiae bacterium]
MDTPYVPTLLESFARELERSREVSAQVANHVIGTYGLNRDTIGPFLVKELPGLEDYEIDLILSPLFTPTLRDQAVFAEILGRESLPSRDWPDLIQQLVARPTHAQLVTEDQQTHSVRLRQVTIERYVHRLRLDATIPEPLFKLIAHFPSAADRPLLKAIARRAIWQTDSRAQILIRYLLNTNPGEGFDIRDSIELLKLMETYEPADANELLKLIPHWQQVLRQEINEGTGTRPFFNERVEELHGGGRDQRRRDSARLSAKEKEQAFLDRLQRVLAA